MPETREEFARILTEAVDYSLLLLGPSARKAIYFHLEKDYSIAKDRIPENMQAFAESLERMFGTGAHVIERLILENVHSKLGLKIEEDGDNDFLNCLDKAKEIYLNRAETQTQQMSRSQLQMH